MTFVKIAQFKSHLSYYLNRIRNGGEVIVTDRKTPIARVVPYAEETAELLILPASGRPSNLRKINIPAARTKVNSLKALREERGDDLERA